MGAREVLPAVRDRVPGARLRLVGRESGRVEHLRDLPGVESSARSTTSPRSWPGPTSWCPDALRRRHPAQGAGGLRAPAAGGQHDPGSEGTGAVDGEHLLLRDDPEGTAGAVAALLSDAGLRERLVDAGEQLYRDRFRPAAAVASVGALVHRLLPGRG